MLVALNKHQVLEVGVCQSGRKAFPATLKSLSTGAEVAGIARYWVASLAFCDGGSVTGVLWWGFCDGGSVMGVLWRGFCDGGCGRVWNINTLWCCIFLPIVCHQRWSAADWEVGPVLWGDCSEKWHGDYSRESGKVTAVACRWRRSSNLDSEWVCICGPVCNTCISHSITCAIVWCDLLVLIKMAAATAMALHEMLNLIVNGCHGKSLTMSFYWSTSCLNW